MRRGNMKQVSEVRKNRGSAAEGVTKCYEGVQSHLKVFEGARNGSNDVREVRRGLERFGAVC